MSAHELAYTRGITLVDYGREAEHEIAKLQGQIEEKKILTSRYTSRWLAMKLLEEDREVTPQVEAAFGGGELLDQVRKSIAHLRGIHGDDVDTLIADHRYGYISGLVKEAVTRPAIERITMTDKIDRIVTNRVLGLPILLLAMAFVFQMTASVSGPYLDWVDGVIGGPIANWVVSILGLIGLGGTWVESLFVDGIIAGVGGVVVFVPVLLFLYFFLALLEDSGYMARAAFVMDRLMHSIGLHGKSFLPMLIGFGCTVPAIYATRTLENEDDRRLTAFLTPMMSCGARLPVYLILCVAFFPHNAGQVILGIYLLGVVMAIVTGLVFNRTLFKAKEKAPFVMELPPYHLPTLKGVLIHMWERSAVFVRKAGGIIMLVSIVLWFLMNIPWGVEEPRDSLFGQVSASIAPIFTPLGCDDWEASGALVTGFIAKEVVVGTMSEIYVGAGEEEEAEEPTTFVEDMGFIVTSFVDATVDTVKMTISLIPGVNLMGEEAEEEDTALVEALQEAFTPLSAISFMIFVLLYVPCMVAVAAMRAEFGTKWMLINAAYLTGLAWVVSVIVYQGGRLLGFG